jgi:hypothetical protein
MKRVVNVDDLLHVIKHEILCCESLGNGVPSEDPARAKLDGKKEGLELARHFIEKYTQEVRV